MTLKIMEDATSEPAQKASLNVAISKAWGEKTAHSTSYDGGKIVMCRGLGAKNLYGYAIRGSGAGDGEGMVNEELTDSNKTDTRQSAYVGSDKQENRTPFLAAMCNGDVALIDANRGIKVRTLRVGLTVSAGVEVAYMNGTEEDYDQVDPDGITMFALSFNDCDIITASRNTVLRHYDISGKQNISYKGEDGKGAANVRKIFGKSHRLPVKCMEFHKSGVFFATGSVDGSAKVWDMRGGFATHAFQPTSRAGGLGGISALGWSPGDSSLMLAAATETGSICIYDLKDSSNVIELDEHVSTVTCMRWTSDGEFFFTSGRDAVINMWSVEKSSGDRQSQDRRPRKKGKTDTPETPRPFYTRVGTQPVYEQIEGMEVTSIKDKEIVLATAGDKGQVRLWKTLRGDVKQGEAILGRMENITSQCTRADSNVGDNLCGYTALLSSHEGKELVAVDGEHNMTFLEAQSLSVNRTIVGHNDEILDLCIIPQRPASLNDDAEKSDMHEELTSQKIAVATNSAQVRIFDLSTFSSQVLFGHEDTVLALDVSPCGRFIVTSGKDNSMRLWHVESARCIGIATGHTEGVGATALSRKIGKYEVSGKASQSGAGAFAITASKDRTLKRWRLAGASELENMASKGQVMELEALGSVRAHEKDINIVSVSPNDAVIASGSQDKTVKLWNPSDLSLQGVLKGHKRGIWDCQFSPYDRVVATSSADQTIKIWSLSTHDCLRTFQGHTASVLRVRFLTGGLQLLSSGADGLIKLWTIRSNECEATMDGHTDKVWALDLSTEGDILVSGGADSRIVVWNDITEEQEQTRREAAEGTLLLEQRLANHLRFKEYEQALDLALDLDRPKQAQKVFSSLIENELRNGRDGIPVLQGHVKTWSMSRVLQVLRYCREWNIRARNCDIAMLVVKTIFAVIPVAKLAATDGIPEIMAGLMPYAERHFTRLDRLYGNSYLLDFTLHSIGALIPEEEDATKWEGNESFLSLPKRFGNEIEQVSRKNEGEKAQLQDSDNDILTIGESDSDSE
jgi:U3 small nucleolar RNA-associated protein 13